MRLTSKHTDIIKLIISISDLYCVMPYNTYCILLYIVYILHEDSKTYIT